ncbi:MAG: hypothetical protein A2928_01025 [Candidatus Taylorbacteria bacterium RIFCSPLOWO2_01_FULL_45_15b]|uniref:Large ribosomal subunit protein uL15 n=1 Tax=Candidatus Taylorbacteria bacterium RIFCSPLOWO2_01_FULL_45_15b TaxID=1802319 RepID=A0A1G2NA19_9BACT|nr:MAG: hypothetical protein A2928_01025 [Candidatus Taylorbacteria bacterium RIFCSPLOWO2_01_FULL_45_15b]
MQLHSITRSHPNKKARQVGRGGKRGKTSGRGTKGQLARAGHKVRPEMRDFIKRVPKLRGRGKNIFQSFRAQSEIVSLKSIEKHFSAGAEVTPDALVRAGLLEKINNVIPKVKILGNGSLTKKVEIKGCLISEAARRAVVAAGGTVV